MLILALPCTCEAADTFGYLISQAILLLTYTITLALQMNYLFLPRQVLSGRLLKTLWVQVGSFVVVDGVVFKEPSLEA